MKRFLLLAALFAQSCAPAYAADQKISALTAYPQASWIGTDLLPIVDITNTTTKKTTIADFDARFIKSLTGDVTASGGGAAAATIANNAVTNAKFRQGVALSVVGVTGNATANVADIAAGADARVLRRSGTTIGFGAIDLSSSNAVANVLANANTTGNAATGANTLALRDANGVVELQVKNPINTQSGTTYTLVAGDNGKIIKFTSGSAITLTVPAGLGAAFNCMVEQDGGGLITFTASSTTLHQAHSLTKTFGQYSVVTLVATAADVFVMSGDMQ